MGQRSALEKTSESFTGVYKDGVKVVYKDRPAPRQ